MKKILFYIIGLSIAFPFMSWGDDDNVKYIPQPVETGGTSELKDAYLHIVRYRYNPIEDHWKVCPNRDEIKYNPMKNTWSYVNPGEVLRYIPADDDWDYAHTETQLRYDIIQEKWWYGFAPPKKGQHPKTLTTTSPLP